MEIHAAATVGRERKPMISVHFKADTLPLLATINAKGKKKWKRKAFSNP